MTNSGRTRRPPAAADGASGARARTAAVVIPRLAVTTFISRNATVRFPPEIQTTPAHTEVHSGPYTESVLSQSVYTFQASCRWAAEITYGLNPCNAIFP